jgi:hypothetical protein
MGAAFTGDFWGDFDDPCSTAETHHLHCNYQKKLPMKNTFLTLLFLLCVGGVTAQKTDRPQNESAPQEETFDQMPAFPGDLNHYMINELHYPAIALKENIEGRTSAFCGAEFRRSGRCNCGSFGASCAR